MSEPSRYRPDLDGDWGAPLALGEHSFSDGVDGHPKWLRFGCRKGEGHCQIALRPNQKNGVGASWAWDGNREAPTITPSINCEKVCGWHGHLTAGRFKPD